VVILTAFKIKKILNPSHESRRHNCDCQLISVSQLAELIDSPGTLIAGLSRGSSNFVGFYWRDFPIDGTIFSINFIAPMVVAALTTVTIFGIHNVRRKFRNCNQSNDLIFFYPFYIYFAEFVNKCRFVFRENLCFVGNNYWWLLFGRLLELDRV
jgi:hypothetical protein